MARKTFTQAFAAEHKKRKTRERNEAKKRGQERAARARKANTDRNRNKRENQALKKRQQKYLGWSELLCMKHNIPKGCAVFIAREGMRLHANKSELENVVLKSKDWNSYYRLKIKLREKAKHIERERALRDRQQEQEVVLGELLHGSKGAWKVSKLRIVISLIISAIPLLGFLPTYQIFIKDKRILGLICLVVQITVIYLIGQ